MIMNETKRTDYISPQAEIFVIGIGANLLTSMSATTGGYEPIDLNDPSFEDIDLDNPF